MTRRATFTKADLARAVSVADQLGKVALWTPEGIAFVESGSVALPSQEQARGNSCDEAFGVQDSLFDNLEQDDADQDDA